MISALVRPRPARRAMLVLVAGLAAGVLSGCEAGYYAETQLERTVTDSTFGQIGDVFLRNVYIGVPKDGFAYPVGADAPVFLAIVNQGIIDDRLVSVTTPAAGSTELVLDPSIGPAPPTAGVVLGNRSSSPSFDSFTDLPTPTPTPPVLPSAGGAIGGESPSAPDVLNGSSQPVVRTAPPTTGATRVVPFLPAPAGSRTAAAVGGFYVSLRGLNQKLITGTTIPMTFTFAQAGALTLQVPVETPASPLPSSPVSLSPTP